MNVKITTLYNGSTIPLYFLRYEDGYYINAQQEFSPKVANLHFDIIDVYTLLKKVQSQNKKIPTKIYMDTEKLQTTSSKIENDILISKEGNVYKLKEKICDLKLIEIFDEKYYKVGLGTAMFKLMEEFAIKNGCSQISAWVAPMGKFLQGAMIFYKRNGFVFGKNYAGHPMAIKTLSRTKEIQKDKK